MQAHGMLEACAQAPSPEEVRKERIRAIAVLYRPSRARSHRRRANAERNRRRDGCGGSLQSLAAFHVAKFVIFGHETAFWHGLRAFASEGKPATWHFLDEKPLRLPDGGENRSDSCQNAVSWPKTSRLAARDRAAHGETPSGALLGEEPRSKNRSGRRTRKPESAAALPPTGIQANSTLPRPRPSHQAKRTPLSAGAKTHRARRLLERKPSFSARRRASAARERVSASHPGARHPERALAARPLPRRAAAYMWRRRSTASHSASEAA